MVNDESVSGSATSYTANLQAGKQYRWDMRAKNSTGWGSYSGDLYFQTPGGTATGTISASPNPCTVTVAGGTCTLTLSWSSTGATAARVYVIDANNAEQLIASMTSGSQASSSQQQRAVFSLA